ncbi:MAG TPA: hypothetical protein VEJ63_19315 [Planctomycetota bacterium]|nr:hypothetical protein [Planctomycetota bacterium]
MKLKCWACAIIGFLLLCSYARSADEAAEKKPEPKLALVKGTVVRVTDKDIVVKSSDEKQGEVAYPLAETARNVWFNDDVFKKLTAEDKTKGKYMAKPTMRVTELQPGTKVKVAFGYSHISNAGKVEEEGHYYQMRVEKLPEDKD